VKREQGFVPAHAQTLAAGQDKGGGRSHVSYGSAR
jgi:hypothetical protein